MEQFMFTFNGNKLLVNPKNNSNKISTVDIFPCIKPKSQVSLRSFRSRQIKRYDKIIQSINSQNHITMNLPQQIMSQNLQKINEVRMQIAPYSSKNIEDTHKTKVYCRTNRIFSQQNRYANKKNRQDQFRTIQIQNKIYISPKLKQSIETICQNTAQKMRSVSLTKAPMVQFPKDDKKLPTVFRVNNKSCQKRSRLVEMSTDQYTISHSPLKSDCYRKLVNNKIKSSAEIQCNSQPRKIYSNMSEEKNEFLSLNQQEKTPFFTVKK